MFPGFHGSRCRKTNWWLGFADRVLSSVQLGNYRKLQRYNGDVVIGLTLWTLNADLPVWKCNSSSEMVKLAAAVHNPYSWSLHFLPFGPYGKVSFYSTPWSVQKLHQGECLGHIGVSLLLAIWNDGTINGPKIAGVGWCLPVKVLLRVEEMVQSAEIQVHIDEAQFGRIFALSVRFAMFFHSTWGAHVKCCHVASCCIAWSLCGWDRSMVSADDRIKLGCCEPYTCKGPACPDT